MFVKLDSGREFVNVNQIIRVEVVGRQVLRCTVGYVQEEQLRETIIMVMGTEAARVQRYLESNCL